MSREWGFEGNNIMGREGESQVVKSLPYAQWNVIIISNWGFYSLIQQIFLGAYVSSNGDTGEKNTHTPKK